MVLFVPAMNLLEGFDSDYRQVVMALNIVACIIDVILHTSLVSMSNVFITAEDSKKAIKIMRLKDKALAKADQNLRAFNNTFMKAKTAFTSSAKHFVSSFKELQSMNETAALNTLYQLDNFTIWMINNKVMQHSLIPYHSDENGHPVIEMKYFTSEQDSMRIGWDILSTVKVDNMSSRPTETLNSQRPVSELSEGNDTQHQHQYPVENTNQHSHEVEQTENQPVDYDAILDSVNPNDKIL